MSEVVQTGAVTQAWLHDLTFMQQTVLLTAIRGPDGVPKYHSCKFLVRWYRRCVLRSSLDGGRVIDNPYDRDGGSFMGPSYDAGPMPGFEGPAYRWEDQLDELLDDYLRSVDALPHHFHLHFMHAAEILGYKHPDERIRAWWGSVYLRLVEDMHLHPESEAEMDSRLGDDRAGWLRRADPATVE